MISTNRTLQNIFNIDKKNCYLSTESEY